MWSAPRAALVSLATVSTCSSARHFDWGCFYWQSRRVFSRMSDEHMWKWSGFFFMSFPLKLERTVVWLCSSSIVSRIIFSGWNITAFTCKRLLDARGDRDSQEHDCLFAHILRHYFFSTKYYLFAYNEQFCFDIEHAHIQRGTHIVQTKIGHQQ